MIMNKGNNLVLAMLVAVMLLLPVMATAQGITATTATIAGGTAIVYAAPTASSVVLSSLSAGSAVQVLSFDNSWAEVIIAGGQVGYVMSAYINFGAYVPVVPTVPSVMATVTVGSGPLNVHAAKSLSATVITQLATGTSVQLSSYDSEWAEVILGAGRVGYVVTSYLNFGAQPSVTAEPHAERVNTEGANATISTANSGPLHMRTGASFEAPIIHSFSNGSRVRVISRKEAWYYAQAGSQTGYMDIEFIQLDSGVELNNGAYFDAVVHNPSDGQILHLREKPSTDGKILGEYKNGTYVEVLGVGAQWLRVVVMGKTGYMMTEFVNIVSPQATPYNIATNNNDVYVNVYASQVENENIVVRLDSGTSVLVLIPEEVWSEVSVTVDGKTYKGFIKNEYLAPQQFDSWTSS